MIFRKRTPPPPPKKIIFSYIFLFPFICFKFTLNGGDLQPSDENENNSICNSKKIRQKYTFPLLLFFIFYISLLLLKLICFKIYILHFLKCSRLRCTNASVPISCSSPSLDFVLPTNLPIQQILQHFLLYLKNRFTN